MLTKEEAYELFLKITPELDTHVRELERIVRNSVTTPEEFEGNSFYKHGTFELQRALVPKQMNFFWCGLQSPEKICEIGFNAGHSLLLMLLGCAQAGKALPSTVTIFDICEHPYTEPCYEYIRGIFPSVTFEFIKGDSGVTMAEFCRNKQHHASYDIVHVDGGHSLPQAHADIFHSLLILKKEGILIVDDIDNENVKLCLNKLYKLRHFNMFHIVDTPMYPHVVLKGYSRLYVPI